MVRAQLLARCGCRDKSWAVRAPPLEIEIEADHRRVRFQGVEIDTLDSNGDCTFTAQSVTYDVVPGVPGPEPEPEPAITVPRLFGDVGELVRALQE